MSTKSGAFSTDEFSPKDLGSAGLPKQPKKVTPVFADDAPASPPGDWAQGGAKFKDIPWE